MKRTQSVHLLNDIKEETPICQYMDLEYLIVMLENKTYHVNRKYSFDDSSEGLFPLKKVIPAKVIGDGLPHQPEQNIDTCLNVWQNIQKNKCVPTACWTHDVQRRLYMWKMFTAKYGVNVKSSVHNFIASIEYNDYDIWCGKMTYNGYDTQKSFIENMFSKRPIFSEEKECRFYFFEREKPENALSYILIKIDPSIMIDEIEISPFIESRTASVLANMIQSKYNVRVSPLNIL